jgi:hypothetical protein
MDACGLNSFGQGQRRQDSGESPGQHRLASPRGAEQEHIMVRTPASALALSASRLLHCSAGPTTSMRTFGYSLAGGGEAHLH